MSSRASPPQSVSSGYRPSLTGGRRAMATAQQEGCNHEVCITKAEMVYPRPDHDPPPATRHSSCLLKLSNLDRQCPVLMYSVFFYRSPPPEPAGTQPHSPKGSLFSSLKTGLEEALREWYPAAGRLSLNPLTGKLDLVCNNAGALLVEAGTEKELSQLGDLSQHNSFYENLVFQPPVGSHLSDGPLVVAQVTRFACGGYAVGVGTSHALFDGWANFSFLNAWASKVPTAVTDERVVALVRPVHERDGLLLEQDESQQYQLTGAHGEPKAAGVRAFDHIQQLIAQAASDLSDVAGKDLGGCKYAEMSTDVVEEQHVLVTYHITHGMIEKLKREADRGQSGISCSSFEVVAAHLWQDLYLMNGDYTGGPLRTEGLPSPQYWEGIRAQTQLHAHLSQARMKTLSITKDRIVCLQFAMDARNKLSPPLPCGFAGNAYVLSSTAATAGVLVAQTLLGVVEMIKEAKSAVTHGYVRAYLAALEAPQEAAALPPLPELTMVSDWTRTPYHEVDFGLGSAAYAAALGTPLPQVAYFLRSPREGGGVDVRIGLLPGQVEAFSNYFFATL